MIKTNVSKIPATPRKVSTNLNGLEFETTVWRDPAMMTDVLRFTIYAAGPEKVEDLFELLSRPPLPERPASQRKDESWDERFLEMAYLVASWSKDPSTKVGCVLVNPDRHVISTGYNGLPRSVVDSTDRYEDRSVKYLMTQHAEMNAVSQAVGSCKGSTAYVTHFPCSTCAGLLINAGVAGIVTREPSGGIAERFKDSFAASRKMFEEAGVEISMI